MSESGNDQRWYRAPCPGCGAPVVFRSAQSTHAVCGYCASTVVRQGEVLQRIGKMAELFDDHSLLQLQVAGVYENCAFVLTGRLQYQSAEGRWTEWVAAFDDGTLGVLAEDNGAYVMARAAPLGRAVPAASHFRLDSVTAVSGCSYTVAFNGEVSLLSAQGELPKLPALGKPFAAVELRGAAGDVIAIDYGVHPPQVTRGLSVQLDGLQLSGLKDSSERLETGRQLDCPACGAPVSVQLASSKSLTCGSCHSLLDLSQGVGADLVAARQTQPVAISIPLGRVGRLEGLTWQVVGFQHRMGWEPGDSDEQFGWEEYLLYNARRGFAFLVDSTEGWSLVRPVTGSPQLNGQGNSAQYRDTHYTLLYSYNARTSYVEGEFYWPVQQGQTTFNQDFADGKRLLSAEKTPREVVWSVGKRLEAATVAGAFGLTDRLAELSRADAGPLSALSSGSGWSMLKLALVGVGLVVLLVLITRCSSCDPQVQNCSNAAGSGGGWRSSGGSWGGSSSSSGGHK
jgi:ribosomal protein S27E